MSPRGPWQFSSFEVGTIGAENTRGVCGSTAPACFAAASSVEDQSEEVGLARCSRESKARKNSAAIWLGSLFMAW
jgi:hypothetical protein